MTEHKFTDEEIIKAMDICQKSERWGDCENMGCPAAAKQGCRFYLRTDEDYEGVVQDEMLKDALDLINRQNGKITIQQKIIDDRAKEIFRYDSFIRDLHKQIETVKAEAVKEFAEMLKKYYRHIDKTSGALIEYHIDKKAKEFLGEGGDDDG